jgi:hypothetical protein
MPEWIGTGRSRATWIEEAPMIPKPAIDQNNLEEGVLQLQASGRWAISCPGRKPVEIADGAGFFVEVFGYLLPTRLQYRGGAYSSVHGYYLADGLRAAVSR